MMLAGPRGIGKADFAEAFAQRLLCTGEAAEWACGTCPACRWFAGGNHPDIRRVVPEIDQEVDAPEGAEADISVSGDKKKSVKIKIKQVSELLDFVYVGSGNNSSRVVIVSPVEAMTPDAANSILKVLEEPPPGIYFLMISFDVRSVLPTIRSRCRVIPMHKPDEAQANAWLSAEGKAEALPLLAMSGNAPLLAVEEFANGRAAVYKELIASVSDSRGDPVALAGRWEPLLGKAGKETGLRMEELVVFMQKWAGDLASHCATGRLRYFPAQAASIARLTGQARLEDVVGLQSDLVKIKRLANHPLNARLVLDDLAARYLRAIQPGR
jgi:DNA polymerase-3 subunit delta'